MHRILAFLVVFLLFETSYGQTFQDTIPFRNDLGLIIIPIMFNGMEKEFAFDTGAEHSVAYGWAKESLQKTNKSITITSSSGLKSSMRFYKSGTIELGSRKIRGHRILNAQENEFFSCHQIDGILGVDIIKEFHWIIDYPNKRLIMYPTNFTPPQVKNMHELHFTFHKNRPYVFLKRKENTFRFLLDTGAGGYSDLSKQNYNLTNLNDFEQVSYYSGSIDVNGILTASQPKIFQLPEMSSKDVILEPVVSYNNQKSTKLGNKLWEGKQLFLSLKEDQLWISESKIKQSFAGYDCTVMYRKGKIKVTSIIVDSDPWKQGLRQGDEVTRVNGKSFSDFCTLDQYQRMLMKTEKPFDLELTNGKVVTVSLQKKFNP